MQSANNIKPEYHNNRKRVVAQTHLTPGVVNVGYVTNRPDNLFAGLKHWSAYDDITT